MKEDINFQPVSGQKNTEFFDYLAYNGVKNQKAAQLQKIKEKEDLEGCTFKPKIINYPKQTAEKRNVYESLMNAKKDTNHLEQVKQKNEMKGCTFKPNIDRKSNRIASAQRGNIA